MKFIYIVALVLFLVAPVAAQRVMNERELYGLKSNVLTVIVKEAKIAGETGKEIEKPGEVREARHFSPTGGIVKSYDSSASNLVRIYNNAGGAVTFKEMTAEEADKYVPDGENKPAKKLSGKDFDFQWKYTYTGGFIAEKRLLTKTGAEVERYAYEYEKETLKIRLLKITVYQADKIASTTTFERDANGYETRRILDPRGSGNAEDFITTAYTDYEFDAQGNWTKRTEIVTRNQNGKLTTAKFVAYRQIKYYGN